MSRHEALTGWRKIASAVWGAPADPQIYGAIELDATRALAFMERARAAGHRVTPTHLVGRAIAVGLHAVPDFNIVVRGSRAYRRPSVDVFFIAAVEGGRDLSGVRVTRADEKSVFEVADELRRRASAMRRGDDPDFARTKGIMETLPRPLLRTALRFSAKVSGDLGMGIRALSIRPYSFGSAMVSSLGMYGIPLGWAPISWLYRVPLLVLVGEVAQRAVVVDGRVEARPVLPLTATIDHRYVDGWHISEFVRPFRAYIEDPAGFEPEPPARPDPVGTAT